MRKKAIKNEAKIKGCVPQGEYKKPIKSECTEYRTKRQFLYASHGMAR